MKTGRGILGLPVLLLWVNAVVYLVIWLSRQLSQSITLINRNAAHVVVSRIDVESV